MSKALQSVKSCWLERLIAAIIMHFTNTNEQCHYTQIARKPLIPSSWTQKLVWNELVYHRFGSKILVPLAKIRDKMKQRNGSVLADNQYTFPDIVGESVSFDWFNKKYFYSFIFK